MPTRKAIDFELIRSNIADIIEEATGLLCILQEPTVQNAARPQLPYFAFKITTAAAKYGRDASTYVSGQKFNKGGQRRMSVSFNCYAKKHDESYDLMTLLQSTFELETIQEQFRRIGIAVWSIGAVADLSTLLNTGYEARAQMDVQFGVAANLEESLGVIDHVDFEATVEPGHIVDDFSI